jgi:hypothetical protein
MKKTTKAPGGEMPEPPNIQLVKDPDFGYYLINIDDDTVATLNLASFCEKKTLKKGVQGRFNGRSPVEFDIKVTAKRVKEKL